MRQDRITTLASAIVLATGILWGFYWLPVRALEGMGLPGPWGTAAITGAAVLALAPFARGLRGASGVAVISTALGGAAFALYSVGFIYGRVAMIILMWFLTPVWSTLIGRLLMGWATPRLRLWAIALGLCGLGVMLGADGSWPLPRSAGEWMALIGGMIWAGATTGIRVSAPLAPAAAAFVFAVGASAAALLLAPLMAPAGTPWAGTVGQGREAFALALVTGGLWWGLSTASLMWAAARLDPARVGILMMTEVLVGAVSAAVWARESLSAHELIGGALVLCAGVLEVWPLPRPRSRTGRADD